MKEMKSTRDIMRILALALGISAFSHVQAQISEEALRDFTRCDASLFKRLNREAGTWGTNSPLATENDVSWIRVPNRVEATANHVEFSPAPVVSDLKLLSYFDEISDLGSLGSYYFWGFMVAGSLDDVATKLKSLIHDSSRLRRMNSEFVRTEVKVGGSDWRPIATSSGVAPGLLRTERVFLIEPEKERSDVVRLSCSLQGGITAGILKEVRPDIRESEYPQNLKPALFDDVQPSSQALTAVAAATTGGDMWKPKFKRLSYTAVGKKLMSRESRLTVELEAQTDGLLRAKEIYDSNFSVQRLTLANFVSLKSRINGLGDGRVFAVKEMTMSLPKTLESGAKLSAEWHGEDQPARQGELMRKYSLKCEVKERYQGSQIHEAITGNAAILDCAYEGLGASKPMGMEKRVLLEDFGIVIDLGAISVLSGGTSYRIVRFDVER